VSISQSMSTKRDQRDPEKLYERIKTVQKNNDCTFVEAAEMVEQMHKAHKNGKVDATH